MSEVVGTPSIINLKEVAPPGISAGIFDMDDLMVNTHPLHMKVFENVLAGYGVHLNDPDYPWTVTKALGPPALQETSKALAGRFTIVLT